ncbi:MAG: hypothetical protein AB7R69_06470 [Candidatus Babeliales bacterium]
MEKCEQCGNAYGRTFHINIKGQEFAFDSFECAIEKLAPRCASCGTRVIGHGLEQGLDIYCCAQCARMHGITDLKDHLENA